jgi:YVTN family beta-propeller protein
MRRLVLLLAASALVIVAATAKATTHPSTLTSTVAAAGAALPGQRGTLWVVNRALNNVAVFDGATGDLKAVIPVGRQPNDVTVAAGAGKAYVTNEGDNTVSVISTSSLGVEKTIPVGSKPHHVKVRRDGTIVYFGLYGTNKIGHIATGSDSYTDAAASDNKAALTHSVFPAAEGRTDAALATNEVANTIASIRFDEPAFQWEFAVGSRPSEVLQTRDGETAYVSVRNENQIKRLSLSPRTITASVSVGSQPDTLQLSPDERMLVVGLRGSPAQLAYVDTASMQLSATVTIGGSGTTAGHEWLSANGRYTFAAFEGPGAGVAVLDNKTHAVLSTYPYPGAGRPHGVYYDDPASRSGPNVALQSTSLRATRGVVPLRVTCGLDSVGFCRGFVALKSGRPANFSLAPGEAIVAKLRLTQTQKAGLRQKGTLRLRGTLFAYDQLRIQVSRSFSITIRGLKGPLGAASPVIARPSTSASTTSSASPTSRELR